MEVRFLHGLPNLDVVIKVLIGSKVFMDARSPVKAEEFGIVTH